MFKVEIGKQRIIFLGEDRRYSFSFILIEFMIGISQDEELSLAEFHRKYKNTYKIDKNQCITKICFTIIRTKSKASPFVFLKAMPLIQSLYTI